MSDPESKAPCFGVIFNAQGDVVDAGPVDQKLAEESKGEKLLVLPGEARIIGKYINLSRIERITLTQVYITPKDDGEMRGCVVYKYPPGQYVCVPCREVKPQDRATR